MSKRGKGPRKAETYRGNQRAAARVRRWAPLRAARRVLGLSRSQYDKHLYELSRAG